MRRRAYLAALPAVALAGCSRNGDGGDGSDDTYRTPLGVEYDHFREVRIDDVEQGALAETPLRASVTASDRRITADGTTTVTLRLDHEGSEPVLVERQQCPPADVHVGTRPDRGEDKRLLLLRAGEYEGDRAAGASEQCWRPSHFDLNVGEPCRWVGRELDPGETWERAYRVWDDPNNGGCLPPGPYEFELAYAVVPASDGEGTPTETPGETAAATETTTEQTTAGGTEENETTAGETDDATTTAGRTPPSADVTWSFTVGMYDPGMASETTDGEE